jgi:hypothetical protein
MAVPAKAQYSAPQISFTTSITASMVGVSGFKEEYFTNDEDARRGHRWGSWMARRSRYETYWAYYENTVYRKIHRWSELLKNEYQLYTYTRSIFSPAYRMGEFWPTHLMGGRLDCEAGDGEQRPSALPIILPVDEDPADVGDGAADSKPVVHPLRLAIAQLWRDSNWQVNKENYCRNGAVMGDTALIAIDDVAREKVYFKVLHPRTIQQLVRDPFGNVKGYVIQETRLDPRWSEDPWVDHYVTYTEVCTKTGEAIHYQTYLDEEPWDWRDYPDETPDSRRVGPEWTENYGFVPLVFVPNRNVNGTGWGWSELHAATSKMRELDDLASKLDDQIRKLVDSPWFFSGVANSGDLSVSYTDPTDDDPEPGRTSIPSVYSSSPESKAMALVAPLDISATADHIRSILTELERDHPELQADMATASGDASGRALRVAREKVEAMVASRRVPYDDGLVRMHQMCISIGGQKGYPGYEAFSEASYANGELDHSIGERPVFAVDALDRLEEEQSRATLIKTLTDSGLPLAATLRRAGLAEDEIELILSERDEEQASKQKLQVAAQQDALLFGDPTANDPNAGGQPDQTGQDPTADPGQQVVQ